MPGLPAALTTEFQPKDKSRSGSKDSVTGYFNRTAGATLFPAGFGVAVGERFDDGRWQYKGFLSLADARMAKLHACLRV